MARCAGCDSNTRRRTKPRGRPAVQATMDEGEGVAGPARKRPWPKTLPAQFEAVRDVLDAAETPLRAEDVARNFSRANKNKVTEVLHTLNALSQVHMVGDARFAA